MGASIYILIENTGDVAAHELPTIDGKGIAKNWAILSIAARAANVRPLDDFVSVNREEFTALIGTAVSQESSALEEQLTCPQTSYHL